MRAQRKPLGEEDWNGKVIEVMLDRAAGTDPRPHMFRKGMEELRKEGELKY